MYTPKIRKFLVIALVIAWGATAAYFIVRARKKMCPIETGISLKDNSIDKALSLLKLRRDKDALEIFNQILTKNPENLDALWGKAEVLRRDRKYNEAEAILNTILKKNPGHISSLNSLAYIKYTNEDLNGAINLVNKVLKNSCVDKENLALAYLMMGGINSKRASKGFLNKVTYGTKIKVFFLKAKEASPDMPEVHLAMGTFYLLAPSILGGDLDMAINELTTAVKITPDFATANARLGQAYLKKGDREKYVFFINRTKELDPENEVLKELK